MPRTTSLNDLQLVLLSHAGRRDDGHLLPFPAAATEPERAARDIAALLRRGLVTEVRVADAAASWRIEGETRIGLMLSEAGREAIGLTRATDQLGHDAGEDTTTAAPHARSKRAMVIERLARSEGATSPSGRKPNHRRGECDKHRVD